MICTRLLEPLPFRLTSAHDSVSIPKTKAKNYINALTNVVVKLRQQLNGGPSSTGAHADPADSIAPSAVADTSGAERAGVRRRRAALNQHQQVHSAPNKHEPRAVLDQEGKQVSGDFMLACDTQSGSLFASQTQKQPLRLMGKFASVHLNLTWIRFPSNSM